MKRLISFELLTTFLLLIFTTIATAQDTSYEDGKKYILGGLEVSGLQSYNEQTVKT
ncbi:MAG: outer membrane protein insertion porin family, partial [Sediminicola sp.]